ncbi:MAG: NTP transferase domain-containing protein [Acidimicrobiia bacterium]|nr:NTP transferase domain-containing protein [Acidimicrobiia bacterium]
MNDASTASPHLVIMAAGLGSRFGGVKQLARVGPDGEAFLDFSIKQALAAGFGSVVMIVRSDIEADVRDHLVDQHGEGLPVVYVCQDDLGPQRDKPWGTLHAVLSAADVIDRPFAVINADDYYGALSFDLAADYLRGIDPGRSANVAFEIGNTVPPSGSVTRAVCAVSEGRLTSIVETEDCRRNDDGTFSAGGVEVASTTPVSMNMWCFDDAVLADFNERWDTFLAANADEPKAEAQLPTVVGELMADARIVVDVVRSPERWIGITNPDDYELAREALAG